MKTVFLILCLCATGIINAQTAGEYIAKGNTYYRQQQFDLAESQYTAALQIDPENTTAQYNLGSAQHQQKKYKEAHGSFKKVTRSADKALRAAGHYNQGVTYTKEKKLEESIESYKAALRINPTDQQARENLQKALLELKKKQQEQNEQQKQKQQSSSSMSQKEAERKLKLLQEKEKQLQQRLQNRGGQRGTGTKDW